MGNDRVEDTLGEYLIIKQIRREHNDYIKRTMEDEAGKGEGMAPGNGSGVRSSRIWESGGIFISKR